MSPSRISLNIHGLNVPDRNRLFKHLEALQPAAVLVLDNLALAREIRQILPTSTIIFREFGSTGDGALHTKYSAERWLNEHAHQARDGIVLHVLNEPPFDKPVITWLTDLLKLAVPRRIPLIVGNWAVGNPIPEQWPLAHDLLQLIADNSDLFILGLHEYAGGVVTSGLYGGYPDNAGVKPGQTGGMNLIQPANWPMDVSAITRYHMGRFKFLLNYCDRVGIDYPRIILTEHGFDDTSDIKAWEDTLKKTSPYLNVRGWKTLTTQWQEWFSHLSWSPQRAYFEQLRWASETIYAGSPVEAQCIFCWGYSSKEWKQFDIAEATEFQQLLEAYAQQAPKSQEVKTVYPKPTPFPENLGEPEQYVLVAADGYKTVNGRAGTTTNHETILEIPSGSIVKVWRENAVPNANRLWYPAEYNGRRLWIPQTGYNPDGTLRDFEHQFLPLPVTPDEAKPPVEEKPSDTPPADTPPAEEKPAEESPASPDIEHERLQVLRDLTAALIRLAMALEQRPFTATR